VPVITGETGASALQVFRNAARDAGAPLRELAAAELRDVRVALDGTHFTLMDSGWGDLALSTPLLGAHQAVNAALAVLALGALPERRPTAEAVVAGVRETRWAGRLQLEQIGGVTWLFDVAHNVAGVEAAVSALAALPLPGPLTAVVGVLGDKDWVNMLTPLCSAAARVLLTAPPTAPPERRWDPEQVLREVPCGHAETVSDFRGCLDLAQQHAVATGGSVLVTGSFHTVGDALAAFGLCPDGSDFAIDPPDFLRVR
jgi:dihydrofolate synthase / folylpolyglutamate synthase